MVTLYVDMEEEGSENLQMLRTSYVDAPSLAGQQVDDVEDGQVDQQHVERRPHPRPAGDHLKCPIKSFRFFSWTKGYPTRCSQSVKRLRPLHYVLFAVVFDSCSISIQLL